MNHVSEACLSHATASWQSGLELFLIIYSSVGGKLGLENSGQKGILELKTDF